METERPLGLEQIPEKPKEHDIDDQLDESEREALRARTERLRDNLSLLQFEVPKLLAGLEDSRINRVPFTIYVEGYEHNADIMFALLQCAHVYGVSLTVVPFPMRTLHDSEKKAR